MEDMKVANIEYADGFGAGSVESNDWHNIKKICCFEHKEACEFIVWIGDEGNQERLEEIYVGGMSHIFISLCLEARGEGFKYACFYA